MDGPAIWAEGLTKSFGQVQALGGVDLEVRPATILAMLGPNGAGKTTTVRILTTLLQPDGGRAEVAGYDVVRDATVLRSVIGLAGQFAAVDPHLTGLENLELVGQLYHVPRVEARRRAEDVLERFDLAPAANRTVRTYFRRFRFVMASASVTAHRACVEADGGAPDLIATASALIAWPPACRLSPPRRRRPPPPSCPPPRVR